MIRRGEFYRWSPPGLHVRWVLVLSDDTYNEVAWPVCAVVVRGGQPSLWLVPLADTDPVAGRVALPTIGSIDPADLSGPHGFISGNTYQLLLAGVRELFGT